MSGAGPPWLIQPAGVNRHSVYCDGIILAIPAGSVGVLSLTVWGLLRGYQLRFAAVLAGNPLGQFLAAHPFLASVFYIFITLATPMIGATALLFGWQE